MDQVEYFLEDGLARITLNDGRANALSLPMQDQINTALDRAVEDDAAILLTGSDGMFCAGFDLKTIQAGGSDATDMVIGGFQMARRLLSHSRPVVTASNGHAMAMGLFLLLSGDYVLGARGNFKIAANEVAIGLTMPYSPVAICGRRLGPAHLHRALGGSEIYSPDAAMPAGFIDELCEPDQLLQRAQEKLLSLSELPAKTFAETKLRLHHGLLEQLDAAIAADREDFKRMFGG